MIVSCPQCYLEFYKDEPWKRICINCYKANKRKEQNKDQEQPRTIVRPAKIPPDVLKKLIYLCHPDKHKNSQISTDIFIWLTEFKKSNL